MTPADDAAKEAFDALAAALHQLGQQVMTPLARMDHEARAGYWELDGQTRAIVQRLAGEVGGNVAQLRGDQTGIIGNVSAYEQTRHNNLAAALNQPAQRLGRSIYRAIRKGSSA